MEISGAGLLLFDRVGFPLRVTSGLKIPAGTCWTLGLKLTVSQLGLKQDGLEVGFELHSLKKQMRFHQLGSPPTEIASSQRSATKLDPCLGRVSGLESSCVFAAWQIH